jgi:DnaJ-class molecular chaperone
MDPRLRTRIEVETIAELLPQLNYYQLLQVVEDCPQSDIDAAFRSEGRRLHPDRVAAGSDAEGRAKANEVFKAINDAYRVLRDPDSRSAYDAERRGGRLKLDDEARKLAAEDAAARSDPNKAARTDKGGKYWRMALQNWNEKDFNGCVMNIQFALTFEPNNDVFKEWLAKTKAALEEKKNSQKTLNAYKIRI